MPGKTDIWMPLYIGDYLADTSHLDAERHGCYLLWMMHYWRKGPLPNNPEELLNLGRLRSKDASSIVQALLGEFFTLHNDGLWHQKRQDSEREIWQGKKVSANRKAATAAAARWAKHTPSNASSIPPSNPQAMLELCPSPSPSPSPLSLPEPSPEKLSPTAPSDSKRESALIRDAVERIFTFYCITFSRDPKKYQLTEERRKKAELRFRERLKANSGNVAAVESEFAQAVENLAANDFNVTGGYTDWTNHIFKSADAFERRLNWKPLASEGGSRNGHNKHATKESVFDAVERQRAQAAAGTVGRPGAPGDAGQAPEPAASGIVGADPSSDPW